MRRITKQNKIVVGVISLVLVLTVGYALFSETLNINGTAKASGNFNLIFSEILRNEVVQKGASVNVNDINITNESKTLSIGDVLFNFPSSYIEVATMVENKGSIDAILEGIKVTGLSNEFKLTLTGVKEKELFKSGEKKKVIVKIEWLETSTTTVPKTNFDIELVYNQASSGYVPPSCDEMTRDMFIWDSETIVAGLSDKGIEHLRNNGGRLVIPEGTTEIAGVDLAGETFDKGFSPYAIGKLDMRDATEEEVMENMFITSVEFPSTLKKVGTCAFLYNLKLIGTLILPEGLEEIGESAFNTTGITDKLIIPDNVKIIGDYAFVGTHITSLKLNENVEKIGSYAFSETSITGELIIPSSVKIIEEEAFSFTLINYLKLENGIKIVGEEVFNNCKSLTGELIIPDSVEIIGVGAFAQTNITSLKLGNSIKTIGAYSFAFCNELTGDLIIPDSVQTIGNDAFRIDNLANNKIINVSISKNTSYNESSSFWNRPTPTIRD